MRARSGGGVTCGLVPVPTLRANASAGHVAQKSRLCCEEQDRVNQGTVVTN